MVFHIREMQREDLGEVKNLCLQLGFDVDMKKIEDNFAVMEKDENQGLFVVNDSDGKILGQVKAFMHVFLNPSINADLQAVIDTVVVDEEYRGKGIGKQLMCYAEKWAKEKNCKVLALFSEENRNQSHDFYKHNGFSKIKKSVLFRKHI